MVTLVTVDARTSNFSILLELLILYILVYICLGILNELLIFYELFCEGASALCKYALMVVRGLSTIGQS